MNNITHIKFLFDLINFELEKLYFNSENNKNDINKDIEKNCNELKNVLIKTYIQNYNSDEKIIYYKIQEFQKYGFFGNYNQINNKKAELYDELVIKLKELGFWDKIWESYKTKTNEPTMEELRKAELI